MTWFVMHWQYLLSGRRWDYPVWAGCFSCLEEMAHSTGRGTVNVEAGPDGFIAGCRLCAGVVTLEELRQLEAHKTTPGKASQYRLPPLLHHLWLPQSLNAGIPSAGRPGGQSEELQTGVVHQSRCGYCQQFDPLLKRVTAQWGWMFSRTPWTAWEMRLSRSHSGNRSCDS